MSIFSQQEKQIVDDSGITGCSHAATRGELPTLPNLGGGVILRARGCRWFTRTYTDGDDEFVSHGLRFLA